MDPKHGSKYNWEWYSIKGASIIGDTFHVLDEEHDQVLLFHLRHLQMHFILDGVSCAWNTMEHLSLGFTRHFYDKDEWHCLIWH
jgi:hypothetical protein